MASDTPTPARQLHPKGWAALLVLSVMTFALVCTGFFAGSFRSYDAVTLTADRSGLVMETGAKVKMRGVEVGQVGAISGGSGPVSLRLDIAPDAIGNIPANVQAEIKATTAFGAKYVELIPPGDPSQKRLQAGAVLRSRNVSTEVNTVFENLVGVLDQIDVSKLNATLTAVAEAVRGQGARIGESITDTNEVLLAINPRMDVAAQNWRSFKGFTDAYGAAANDILATLRAASTTSTTITTHAAQLDALLLNVIGLAEEGSHLIGANKANFVDAINTAAPTTALLKTYDPVYTCMLLGAKWFLDNGGYDTLGGNGRSLIVDATFLLGDDPYRHPDNLPVVAAKGGPGGKPSCGSLPDPTKNWPVRQLVTNTGWGTGVDYRPNPGIGHPWYANFFPATRAVPEPPSVRGSGPPAIGPVPYPGAPPYGAPQYGPDGTPLYPGVPSAPAAPPSDPPAP